MKQKVDDRLAVTPRLFGIYQGILYSGFGEWRPDAPAQKYHSGWDVGAATHTNIRALGDGRVVRVRDRDSVRGYHQEISVFYRSAKTYVLYGHVLAGIVLDEGDFFKQGDILAKVGTSDDAMGTSPHAHIQCWKTRADLLQYINASAIDPRRVREWYGGKY